MAAETAFVLYRWLLTEYNNPAAPLTTCRLLLSPTESEISARPEIAEVAEACTLDHFLRDSTEWRRDASDDNANVTVLYLAGHALERHREEQIVLMEDFGDGIGPLLRNSISTANIFNGMAPAGRQRNIALTQLYFFDMGRTRAVESARTELMSPSLVFDVEFSNLADPRSAVIFYASSSGQMAYGYSGGPTLFGDALLACLRGGAGRREEQADGGEAWVVSVHSLARALPMYVDRIAAAAEIEQRVVIGGSVNEAIVHYLPGPPPVEVALRVDPAAAHACTWVKIWNTADELAFEGRPPAPGDTFTLPAGVYRIVVETTAPTAWATPKPRWIVVEPPEHSIKVALTDAAPAQ